MNYSEKFIIDWNNKFPKDRLYRKKYNIAFGSPEHRITNQIDILLDLKEDILFDKFSKQYIEEKENFKTYKETNKFMKDIELDSKKMDDLFEKLDVSKLNKPKVEEEIKAEDNG